MKNNEEEEQYIKLLTEMFNTLTLSRKQAARALNMSTSTLDRRRQNGTGPQYTKVETGSRSNNGRVFYPVKAIASYIVKTQMQCA